MFQQKVTLTFSGRLREASFVDFAVHRAGRLDLPLTVVASDCEQVTVTVEGQADLIDAFDMACSLGPYDCLVLDVARAPDGPDFHSCTDL